MPSHRTCSTDGCDRPYEARGWCVIHYARWNRRRRDPLVGTRPAGGARLPLAQRLWSGALADGTGCWIWQRARNREGYGCIKSNGILLRAHRVAYEIVKGPIPEGLTIDHLCRVRACINPDHLEPVTGRENTLRGVRHRRQLAVHSDGLTRSESIAVAG